MARSAKSQLLFVALVSVAPVAGAEIGPPSVEAIALPPSPTVVATNFSFDFTGVSPSRVQSTLNGSDPQYNRQEGNCDGLSGTSVYYETITISNATQSNINLTASTSDLDSPGTCAIDTFLAAYKPSFSAGSSSSNCVTSNDDAGGGLCSAVTISLDAGQSATIVASPYASGASFSYQVNFSAALLYENGDPRDIEGYLDFDDGIYNRHAGDCSGLSGIGTAVSFDTVLLTNATSLDGTFSVTTSDQGDPSACTSGDTYLSVYSPAFDPATPLANCLTSNDDGGVGVCSAVSFGLAHEKTVVLVVTSFGNGAFFPYQLNIKGPLAFRDGFESGNRSHWSFSVP